MDAGYPKAVNSGRTLSDMSERARAIFRQLVEAYLSSGEPVGSRTLSQRLPISLSPASVRNVLADLEKMGLLYAPHTSAGRVPTVTTNYGAIWKQWPHYLSDDDRIILRIDGNLYEQRLQRIMQGTEVIPVLMEFNRKYGAGEPTTADTVTLGETWMYEVVSR